MANKVHIQSGDGTGLQVHVHKFSTAERDDHAGLLVLTRVFQDFRSPQLNLFLNDSFGVAMNQNVTFGGSGLRATVVHAGVNSGSADSGTTDGAAGSKLIESGQNFNTTVGPGALVHNTTDTTFALVTAVDSDTQLALSADIMASGESYVVNDIWLGTAVQGTWDFAASGKFTITGANNNDEATFTVDTAHIWNMTDFKALTGKIDLDTYDAANNKIEIEFGLDGVLVGNAVNIDDFIDTGSFSEQSFVITKDDLGLTTQNVNSMRLTIIRSGGAKPTVKFDDFQLENSGTPAVFKLTTPIGTRFHINQIILGIADNITGITAVAGATENATVPNLAYDAFLGVSALTNGITFQRVKDGVITFSASIKQLGGFLSIGGRIVNHISDGTNTFITLTFELAEPIVLNGNDTENFISFTINDDLSGLLQFTAGATGSLEV